MQDVYGSTTTICLPEHEPCACQGLHLNNINLPPRPYLQAHGSSSDRTSRHMTQAQRAHHLSVAELRNKQYGTMGDQFLDMFDDEVRVRATARSRLGPDIPPGHV